MRRHRRPEDASRDAGGRTTLIEPVFRAPCVGPPVNEGDWRRELAAAGELTPEIVSAVLSAHGDRGKRAIEAVSEERVKGYRDFTVVVGYEDEYVVEGGGCTCKDSSYNLDPADPDQRCWHALAVEIAERIDAVDAHDMWYSDVREFL